jgi:hypothetical protein
VQCQFFLLHTNDEIDIRIAKFDIEMTPPADELGHGLGDEAHYFFGETFFFRPCHSASV